MDSKCGVKQNSNMDDNLSGKLISFNRVGNAPRFELKACLGCRGEFAGANAARWARA